jgi:hypothetical protein
MKGILVPFGGEYIYIYGLNATYSICIIYFTFNRAYGLNVIELIVFLMQLIDMCKEGDGEQSIINKKRLLMYLSHPHLFKITR